MADKLTSADISEVTRQSDVTSLQHRTNYTNLKNKINELIDDLAAVAIGTTNAETTAARPYHTNLKERLDSIGSGQLPYVKDGGEVTQQGTPDMTVAIAAGEAKINGIDVKWSAVNSGTITAPVISTGGITTRYDVVVANTDSTITVVTGSESENAVLPSIASTQRPLAVIKLNSEVTTITTSIIEDARCQGCAYCFEGRVKYNWKLQDAIDDLTSGTIWVGKGNYREDLTYASDHTINFESGADIYDSTGTAAPPRDVDLSALNNTILKYNIGINVAQSYRHDGEIIFFDKVDARSNVDIDGSLDMSSGDGIQTDNVYLKTKIVEIGAWDMDATSSLNVAHGLTQTKIRGLQVLIYEDDGTRILQIDRADSSGVSSGRAQITSTNIELFRISGGAFDNTDYNSTGINRGYIVITYEA